MKPRGPLTTKEASEPEGSWAGNVRRSKVSGPAAVPTAQVSAPPEVSVHGELQVAAADPVLVPANTTSQEVEVPQLIGLPPLFLMEMVMATGEAADVAPAFRDAPTMVMLVLAVALLTRL